MQRVVLIFLSWVLFNYSALASTKTIYGYVEKATLVDKNLVLPAKLDTGAKSASLNAKDIKKITRNGKPYLRFTVPQKNGNIQFECEFIGNVSIKLRADELEDDSDDYAKRPMVLMRVKLANKEATIRVNLANRGHFNYPLLLGRQSIIAFNGIVDPGAKYIVS